MEDRPRVFVTRQILPEALDLIARDAEMEVWSQDYPPSPQELCQHLPGVHGVLTNIMDQVDVPLLEAAPQLKTISQPGVGLDNIDEVASKGV